MSSDKLTLKKTILFVIALVSVTTINIFLTRDSYWQLTNNYHAEPIVSVRYGASWAVASCAMLLILVRCRMPLPVVVIGSITPLFFPIIKAWSLSPYVPADTATVSQDAIRRSYDAAIAAGQGFMWISDSDHALFQKACEEPKAVIMGAGAVAGVGGLLPQFARKLLPFQIAVIEAKTEADVAKEAEKAASAPPLAVVG